MVRTGWGCGVLLPLLAGPALRGQEMAPAPDATTLRVRSTLVEVPVLVRTHKGEIVYALTAADFTVTDDGAPQQARLEEDTDSEPLALAIVVETGGAGAKHLKDYRELDGVLEGLVGAVEHKVSVIGFDSAPHVLLPFTDDVAEAAGTLAALHAGGREIAVRRCWMRWPWRCGSCGRSRCGIGERFCC